MKYLLNQRKIQETTLNCILFLHISVLSIVYFQDVSSSKDTLIQGSIHCLNIPIKCRTTLKKITPVIIILIKGKQKRISRLKDA